MIMDAVRPMIDDDVQKLYDSFVMDGHLMTGDLFYISLEEFGIGKVVDVS